MKKIYLDYAATSPMFPIIIKKMCFMMKKNFGNPSSQHFFGRKAKVILENSRKIVADSLNISNYEEIIFNSGGTESNNMAIINTALFYKKKGNHLITTNIEHPSVLKSMKFLESIGFEVTYLKANKYGMIYIEDLKKVIKKNTILVSIMYANNETGMKMPIKEIGILLKKKKIIFHTDIVQAYLIEEIFPYEIGIDLLSISSHKIGGPKGVGVLFKKKNIQMLSLTFGGNQEFGIKSGTENLINIYGFSQTILLLKKFNFIKNYKKKNILFQNKILEILKLKKINFKINGFINNKMSNIINLWFIGISNNLLFTYLDLNNICISIGAACSSNFLQKSYVLNNMYSFYKKNNISNESIRISFGFNTNFKEIEIFINKLVNIIFFLKNKKMVNK